MLLQPAEVSGAYHTRREQGNAGSLSLEVLDAISRALELDPKFELSAAEAGHPIWGPIFRGLKAKQPKQP